MKKFLLVLSIGLLVVSVIFQIRFHIEKKPEPPLFIKRSRELRGGLTNLTYVWHTSSYTRMPIIGGSVRMKTKAYVYSVKDGFGRKHFIKYDGILSTHHLKRPIDYIKYHLITFFTNIITTIALSLIIVLIVKIKPKPKKEKITLCRIDSL